MTYIDMIREDLREIGDLLREISTQDKHPEYGYPGALGICNGKSVNALHALERAGKMLDYWMQEYQGTAARAEAWDRASALREERDEL